MPKPPRPLTCPANVRSATEPLVMYHDGACPLCQAEVLMLKHRSNGKSIRFVDVNESNCEAELDGVTRARALEVIHGRIANGPLIQGVDVFAEAYQRAGSRTITWLLTRRWLRPLLDVMYRFFAAHRSTISRLIGPLLLRLAERSVGRDSQQPAESA